jgi:hypothetical protein
VNRASSEPFVAHAGAGSPAPPLRIALTVSGLLAIVIAGGFFAQVTWATTLWPWAVAPLSYAFIASILTAIAIPVLWIAVSGETAAMQGGAANLAVMYAGMFVYVLTLAGDSGEPQLWPYAVVFAVAGAISAVAIVRTRHAPWRDPRPTPAPVRYSFAAFAVILAAVGTALICRADIFPWTLPPETSVMFGLVYLGAAVYFLHGFLRPHWANAVGQLAGFLAYDLVLLAPFLEHFGVVHGGSLISLVVYVALVLYSGGLAAYYLLVHEATRLGGR